MARKVTVIPANQTRRSEGAETKKKLRVCCYCRVSTEQEEQIGSFENQVEYYTNLINGNPDWIMAGVFADEGISGTGTKKRTGFMDMIKACEEGRVDYVITKSISRFARNTADCLTYSRKLKNLGIPVQFEKENINTMDASGELLFTILSSLAQEESRNISENTQWGIRSKFQQGVPHLNCESFLGYDKDEEGNLVINEEQAAIVRRIYRDFLEGWSVSEISNRLNEEGVEGLHGKVAWYPVSIERVLKNEKHCGDILMQKTYTSDFLTKKIAENNGDLEQYYIKDNHEGIVSREEWDAVQIELDRRERFRETHGIRNTGSCNYDRFYSRVFCGACGGKLIRKAWKGMKEPFWKCEHGGKKQDYKCKVGNVTEANLKKAVVIAWNQIVVERDEHIGSWQRLAAEGNALERYRSRLMIAVTEDGELKDEVPELTRMFLEEIVVDSPTEMTVRFLDGTEKRVRL